MAWSACADPPTLRLPGDVRPVRHRLELTLIPAQDSFSGKIAIDLEVQRPADTVWMNSRKLTIDSAVIRANGRSFTAKVTHQGTEFVGFSVPSPLVAGPAKIEIAFHGEFNKTGSDGLFKEEDGGSSYIFTQFESIDARRAFPCFDEPNFKVPWQLTLHVPQQAAAVSNTPIVSETSEANGHKKVIFEETKPIPSYLVAMAVGPFEFVAGGKAGKNGVPVRIVTPKGKGSQAKYAAEVTGPILDELEKYFGVPYPYQKLDILSVPLFGGAMENPGLITYVQSLALRAPGEDSIERQRSYSEVVAHEMAHQWFGDLVTTAWWNDIWLNEAFASWMASKIIHRWQPEWNTQLDEQNSRLGAMSEDSLVSARQIRQPIQNIDDIANAFDGITYSKGEAVIGMFEKWVGEEEFQRGVQRYIRQYAWRNATAGDFLDSISQGGSAGVTRAFSTFLDQPGLPLVSVNLSCGAQGATLHLAQKRALPLGSSGSTDQEWQVPICVHYGDGSSSHRECSLLSQRSMDWNLKDGGRCPAWVQANADGSGYYRVSYEGDLLDKLLEGRGRHLTDVERVAALGDLSALTTMGQARAAQALGVAAQFSRDPVRQVVESSADIVAGIREHLVPRDLMPNYRRFVEKTFGERAHELGWTAKAGETADTRLLRPRIVPLVALWGTDPSLAAEARQLAGKWLADRKAVDPDVVSAVLGVAARTGEEKLFERLESALPTTDDRQQRGFIFHALGSFRDPALVRRAMRLVLDPKIDQRESTSVMFGPLSDPELSHMPFDFVKENYEPIVSRIPTGSTFGFASFLPFLGNAFCDEKSLDEVQAFFAAKVNRFPGTKRNLDQTLETIRLCIAYQSAQAASVSDFLHRY